MFDIFTNLPDTLIALGTLLGAFGALIMTLRNGRKQEKAREAANLAAVLAEQARAQIVVVNKEVFELGRRVDGRLSELLEKTAALARAEGNAAGREAQRNLEVSDSGFKK